jgi:hypothetical protein
VKTKSSRIEGINRPFRTSKGGGAKVLRKYLTSSRNAACFPASARSSRLCSFFGSVSAIFKRRMKKDEEARKK